MISGFEILFVIVLFFIFGFIVAAVFVSTRRKKEEKYLRETIDLYKKGYSDSVKKLRSMMDEKEIVQHLKKNIEAVEHIHNWYKNQSIDPEAQWKYYGKLQAYRDILIHLTGRL